MLADFCVTCKWTGYSGKGKVLIHTIDQIHCWSQVLQTACPASWCGTSWTNVRATTALSRTSNTCFGALPSPGAPYYLTMHSRIRRIDTHGAEVGSRALAVRCPQLEWQRQNRDPYELVERAKGASLASRGPGLQLCPPASSRQSVLQQRGQGPLRWKSGLGKGGLA